MRETTRDIELNGAKYQLQKMTPETGSWVHSVLVRVSIEDIRHQSSNGDGAAVEESEAPVGDPVEKARGAVAFMWVQAGAILGEELYGKVYRRCLQVCRYYDPVGTPVPVLMADGRVAAPGLQDDAETAAALVLESLQFNVAPFFTAAASRSSARASASSSQ